MKLITVLLLVLLVPTISFADTCNKKEYITDKEKSTQTSRKTALAEALKLAKQGDADAQYKVAYLYETILPINYKESFKWFLKSAEQGNADAQTSIGYKYLIGGGETIENSKEAFKWLLKAAKQGDCLAQSLVSKMYMEGTGGVSTNYLEAYRWQFKLAERGYNQSNLLNNKETLQSILQQADQGDHKAQIIVGFTYFLGAGVPVNYIEAYKWFSVATIMGVKKEDVGVWEELEEKMTKEEVVTGKKLVAEWQSHHNKIIDANFTLYKDTVVPTEYRTGIKTTTKKLKTKLSKDYIKYSYTKHPTNSKILPKILYLQSKYLKSGTYVPSKEMTNNFIALSSILKDSRNGVPDITLELNSLLTGFNASICIFERKYASEHGNQKTANDLKEFLKENYKKEADKIKAEISSQEQQIAMEKEFKKNKTIKSWPSDDIISVSKDIISLNKEILNKINEIISNDKLSEMFLYNYSDYNGVESLIYNKHKSASEQFINIDSKVCDKQLENSAKIPIFDWSESNN